MIRIVQSQVYLIIKAVERPGGLFPLNQHFVMVKSGAKVEMAKKNF